MAHIDLNSDLGESLGAWRMGDDEAMLGIVTSANVACGFHAGDAAGILRTLRAAAERGVSVGAHVAYPDLAGFGRRNMDVASADLRADVIYQIGALQGLARVAGTQVRYVKPHGALYNTIAHDERQAADVIEAIRAIDPGLALVALAGSWWPKPLPTAPTPRKARWSAAAKAARCCTTRPRWPRACCAWCSTAWWKPSTARSPPYRPIPSACTATAPAPWTWPARCVKRCWKRGWN